MEISFIFSSFFVSSRFLETRQVYSVHLDAAFPGGRNISSLIQVTSVSADCRQVGIQLYCL